MTLLRPALVDGILVLLAVEALWLARRDRARGTSAAFAGSFAAAGAGLLVALRAVLANWPAWIALAGLAVAGAGNALHVARHLAGRRGGSPRE